MKIFHSRNPKKTLRITLVTLLILAALVGCYLFAFMRPQPLMDCVDGSGPITAGTIIRHTPDGKKETFTVTSPDQMSGLYQAMMDTQVRFVNGKGYPSTPTDGAFYEFSLIASPVNGQQAGTYSFGCNTNGDLIFAGSDYVLSGESDLVNQLNALFPEKNP